MYDMVEVWSQEQSVAGSVSYTGRYGWVSLLVSNVRVSGSRGAEIEGNPEAQCL